MNPTVKEYYSLKQICEILSISAATGRNWIKSGKLSPAFYKGRRPCFDKNDIFSMKQELKSGKNETLKSRRNKKYISGNALYHSYLSPQSPNGKLFPELLKRISGYAITPEPDLIRILLADGALHLFASREKKEFTKTSPLLQQFLEKHLSFGKLDVLLSGLLDGIKNTEAMLQKYSRLFELEYVYEPGEDLLGMLYLSCQSIGSRKASGSYYTPSDIVQKLLNNLSFCSDEGRSKIILDPCCGTGSFLLHFPPEIKLSQIYGTDVDEISVKITRINLALKYEDADISLLFQNIQLRNFLLEKFPLKYDYIIGNPPWGYDFNETEKVFLRTHFSSASGNKIESYDLFVEQALRLASDHGRISFVLPEAMLNVKAHTLIREILLENASMERISYLGDVFDKVQCPCIIFQIKKTSLPLSSVGMTIEDGNRIFSIHTKRPVNADSFHFLMNDAEYTVFQKIMENKNLVYLRNQADFALGIVTGNNKKYISREKTEKNEPVLKGQDLKPFRITPADNYISFQPEHFQQCAPEGLYRAKEKLLYRFISNKLVFAYDDKQTLSLNSCNLVIPKLEGLNIKYILAILNSSVAQFLFQKQFHSLKVLRMHIERIPIPYVDMEQQNVVTGLVDQLMRAGDREFHEIYLNLDEQIFDLYGLTAEERHHLGNNSY